MSDLKVSKQALPDWGRCSSIAMVYPHKLQGREHLVPFYDKLLHYIPKDIKINLLVKDINSEVGIRRKLSRSGLQNEVEFFEFPGLFDIWIKDFSPVNISDVGMNVLVKFKYNPSYVDKKYQKHIEKEDKIGETLCKSLEHSVANTVYFVWDMGNLTHNGSGTAIISNRFISDNEDCNLNCELKPILHIYLGLSNIIFIPVEPGDVTGHVDGMVRFMDEKVLVVGSYPYNTTNYKFMDRLSKNLGKELGNEYEIIRLKNGALENAKSEGVGSALGNHINFLRIKNTILFPYYSYDISEEALVEFKSELQRINLPIEVIPVDIPEINELARLGGVLNCMTWQTFEPI